MELDYSAIGQRIRHHRKQKGYTQQMLAELSELEPSNISHIERGATKLGLPTMVKIANALEVSVDTLLCDSLVSSRVIFEQEISEVLTDCNDCEVRMLAAMLKSLKEIIRHYAK